MATLAGLPYVPLRFDAQGQKASAGGIWPDQAGVTDLIVISHGWHQDPNDAQDMYEAMLQQFQAQASAGGLYGDRRFGVTGVYWPSDAFRDDLSQEAVAVLGSSPAAAAAGVNDAQLAKLQARAGQLAHLFDMDGQALSDLATYAATGGPGDRDALVTALRAGLGPAKAVDAELRAEHAELLDPTRRGRDILQALAYAGARGAAAKAAGGAQAEAMGLSGGASPALGIFSGLIAGVASVLNQGAYFALKKRAGVVGQGLGALLDAQGPSVRVRTHLVGHSFGARLVTAATSAVSQAKPYSLTLLQGAFSHNALGVEIQPGLDGAYRNVVAASKVGRRIVITHTWNDQAVGIMYALASRASNDVAAGLLHVTDSFGGASDIHGGMGANGALRLKPGEGTDAVLDGRSVPEFAPGGVRSAKCDFIKGHGDIRTPEVARVLLGAMR